MKWMQWVMVLALGAGMGLAGLGCSDNDDDSSDSNPLVGTWTAQSYNGASLGTVSLRLTFHSNGILKLARLLTACRKRIQAPGAHKTASSLPLLTANRTLRRTP